MKFITKLINIPGLSNWFKPRVHHLGRWDLNNKNYLKTDYANMDSCGDILCGKPDHFKLKIKNDKKN